MQTMTLVRDAAKPAAKTDDRARPGTPPEADVR